MKKPVFIIIILLIITLGLLWYTKNTVETTTSSSVPELKSQNVEDSNKQLKITFLNIGQGDASFILFPDGEKMLVDCAIDSRILEALGRVMPFYDREIDYLVVTHPDSDHYGGCIDVLKRFKIKNIIYNGFKKENDALWKWFMDVVKEEKTNYVEIDKEQTWNIASTSIHFLYPNKPIAEITKEQTSIKSDNYTSIIFSLEFDGKKTLFMADADVELEKKLIDLYGISLDSDVLKIGHHGSSGSSSEDFINLVSPEYSIISVGRNTFGHPTPRIIKRLERINSEILRTDEKGDITMFLGRDILNYTAN